MTKRRDVFVLVAPAGRKDEATEAISSWLQQLEGYPGYLGGSVLHETANELVENTIALVIDFDSAERSSAIFKDLKENGTGWPFQPNRGTSESDDQGWILYPKSAPHGTENNPDLVHDSEPASTPSDTLSFDRGDGLFARLFHVHAEVAVEHEARHEAAAVGNDAR